MNIQSVQEQIIKEFSVVDDWTERYKLIIKLGSTLPPFPEHERRDANLVKGCQSQVWLVAEQDDEGNIIFLADSDAAITKGLVALMVKFYSGQQPDTIINTQPDFINEIGMAQHLSPTRANGLVAMIKQMKIYAMAYKAKNLSSNTNTSGS